AQSFNVKNEFTIQSGGIDVKNKTTIINDTLEVLINARSETSFELALYRGTSQVGESTIVTRSNTGRSVARTEYISISQQFGINVKSGDRLEITPLDNNATFYYITNNGRNNKLEGEGS